jgi:carotenoid cleavage dioxygenase
MAGVRFPYSWSETHGARVGLVPLGGRGSDVRWFDVQPCYSFHPLNAHDDGERVVIDLVRYPKMFDTDRLGPDDGAPLLWRWTINTTTAHGGN